MTIADLKAWADTMPADALFELMLDECARAHGYTHYGEVKRGGWVEVEGRYLRVSREHPDRKPAQVAEKLLK